jgi:PAS domain S-box-containing protein
VEKGHRRKKEETEFLTAVGDALASVIRRRQVIDEKDRLAREAQYNLEAVSRSQKEWLDTFDTITDMIFITSPEGIIERANRAFSDYFALSPDEVIGRLCLELFPELGGQASSCAVSPGRKEEGGVTFEFLEKNRNRLFRGSHYPRHGLDGAFTGRVCILRDITEEKETEARLIMTERLASLGEVSAGIAHEINNPLASIASCAEALRLRLEKGKFEAGLFGKYLSIIEEEVTRCKGITSGMLSLVSKSLYEKKLVDIRDVIDRTLEIFAIQRSLKGVEIVRRYAGNLPYCLTSEGEIRQVLLILIGNAFEAMGGSGRLTLTTEEAEGHLVFSVGDSGPGISGEQREKIFEPFFTTKTDSGGTGLGLPIARRILGLYRGRLEVSSRPGEGATFTIFLPLGEEESEGPGKSDPAGREDR